jgi:hypothetical protein
MSTLQQKIWGLTHLEVSTDLDGSYFEYHDDWRPRQTMNQTFWVGISTAFIPATGAIASAVLVAKMNHRVQHELAEIKGREDSYRYFVETVRSGEDPRSVFLGASIPIMVLVDDFRQADPAKRDLGVLNKAMEDEIARDRRSTQKRSKVTSRLRKVSISLSISTFILLLLAILLGAVTLVAFPESPPAKWIKGIIGQPVHHSAQRFTSASPSPSPMPTPVSLPTIKDTGTPKPDDTTAGADSQTAASQGPTSSPGTGNHRMDGSSALLSPHCGSGNAVACVGEVASGVVRTCVVDPTQNILSTNLTGLVPSVVGSVTKCATGAVAAVVPVPTPSPSPSASESPTNQP